MTFLIGECWFDECKSGPQVESWDDKGVRGVALIKGEPYYKNILLWLLFLQRKKEQRSNGIYQPMK